MTLVGYARVSTHSQKEDSQLDELRAAGCEKIFVDRGVSGKLASRPELDKALEYMREGDTLVITRLSRAMRSLHNLLDIVNGVPATKGGPREGGLQQRGIALKVLKQDIDTTSPGGRMLFHILLAIDEFQRELILEGTREGLASARARGRVGGRKRKLTDAQVRHARELYDEVGADGKRAHTVAEIAELVGVVDRGTIYRSLARAEKQAGS